METDPVQTGGRGSPPIGMQHQQPSGNGMMSFSSRFVDHLPSLASYDAFDEPILQDAKTTSTDGTPICTKGFLGKRTDASHNKITDQRQSDKSARCFTKYRTTLPVMKISTANPHARTVLLPGRASRRSTTGTVCTGDPRAHPSDGGVVGSPAVVCR